MGVQRQIHQFHTTPRGMHTIMNYIGSVGLLMQEIDLEEISETAFGGVAKTLQDCYRRAYA